MSEDFWNTVGSLDPTREANVENWLVLPLLEALGHDRSCIDAKVPILFQEGRTARLGRKPEADFVVYAERPFGRATSLIVVETKRTDEPIEDGRDQGESYAQNQRAPLLLMTNGQKLEAWQLQITTESICVLECNVADLANRRADLERYLSRECIKSHCAAIEFKRFDLLAGDLEVYERATRDRVIAGARSAISRTLRDDGIKLDLKWVELLSMRGALVVGSSGFGKTTLAAALVWEALERRWEGKSRALPFDLFLPNLTPGQSIEQFLADRVAAHKSGFTPAMLRSIAREDGIFIVADGFERVEPNRREEVERILRLFQADYPKAQLIVLSRANVAPVELGLRVLHLKGYDPEDLRQLAEFRAHTHPHSVHAFYQAPAHVYRIGEVPLLADLLLDRYEMERKHGSKIAPLFEKWLDTILAASQSVDRALDRMLLEKLACATATGPVSIGRAMELVERPLNAERVLGRLAEADAISLRGTMVELQHEALADYLRAFQFWNTPPTDYDDACKTLTFDPASQFAALLVDTAPNANLRAKAWRAVAKADVRLAIRTLRFAAGDETFGAQTIDSDTQRFLGDICETIETLASTHFSLIADLVREELVGMPTEKLGISGQLSAEKVSYSFFEAKGTEQVKVGRLDKGDSPLRIFGHSLRHYGYGPEAGRILGVERLRNALYKLVKSRELRGGPIWIEECVFGRLRHLVKEYQFPVKNYALQEARDVLERHADERVAEGGFRRGQEFWIEDLLDDIEWLMDREVQGINPWWDEIQDLDLRARKDQHRFASSLHEYHRRRQLAYAEVVEESLPALEPYLPTYRMMPLRLEIEVGFYIRSGREVPTLHQKRWPVETYAEAGADVTFPDLRSGIRDEGAAEAYAARTDELLARFGRWFPERIITWGGSMLPDLRGHDTTFDGLPDESAVVRGAMEWLKRDLDSLFAEIPGDRFN